MAGITDFTKYLQTCPTNDLALQRRAFAYELAAKTYGQSGEVAKKDIALDKALADWNLLARSGTNDPPYYFVYLRGDFYARNNQYTNALADYRKAIELQPTNDVSAYTEMAWFLATCPGPNIGNGTNAVVVAQKGCGKDGYHDGFGYTALAAAHAESGDFGRAVECQKSAAEFGKGLE